MKTVKLTDQEARALQVAIRITTAIHTELVGMSPDTEMRAVSMGEIQLLHRVNQKLT